MSERKFDILLTWVLLAFAVWYGVTMYGYPARAGYIPMIVAAVMAVTLVVRLVLLYRPQAREEDVSTPEPEEARVESYRAVGEGGTAATEVAVEAVAEDPPAGAPVPPEPAGYDSLIRLDGERRRRFITIAAFAIAFYFGIVLAGFVVTTAVLITAVFLVARERPHVAILGGLLSAGAVYVLTVVVLGLQPLRGALFS